MFSLADAGVFCRLYFCEGTILSVPQAGKVFGAEAGPARWAMIWAEAIWPLSFSCEAV